MMPIGETIHPILEEEALVVESAQCPFLSL